jgi:hypothetical protein
MFEIPAERLLEIAKDYGSDIDEVNRIKDLLLKSQIIGDEEDLCNVLSAAMDASNPTVMPEGLKLPPEIEKPLTDEEILRKALTTVYDGEDPSVIDADVEAMLSVQKNK